MMFSLYMVMRLICAISEIESAKILAVFSLPGISRQSVFRPLMHELAKRGHEVVVITPDPAFQEGETPKNLTEIDVSDVSYSIMNENIASGQMLDPLTYSKTKIVIEMIDNIFEAQMKSDQVQELINNKERKFDLLFIDSCVRISISLYHIYRVPIIEFSSLSGFFKAFDGTGSPTNPLVYPSPLLNRINNLTLWEKILQLYNDYSINKAVDDAEKVENKIARKLFGSDLPDLSILRKNIQMIFLNVHPLWDFNRPVSPNLLYLGSLHLNSPKELPKDLKNYLDRSKNGVIYMSFGTNFRASLLSPEKLKIFKNVFFQLPYDILWKWDSDDMSERPENVKILKWFPQSDVLRHPKIKLFITQGGLQSTDEALDAGVPLIGIPLRVDQWFNVEQYVRFNVGMHVDIETMTEDSLKSAIATIIKDNRYRDNVVKLRDLMRDQPQSPLERAVWWTEHVLRHGGATHLRAAAAHMHWTEYYALDVAIILLAVFLAIVLGIIFVIRYVLLRKSQVKLKLN